MGGWQELEAQQSMTMHTTLPALTVSEIEGGLRVLDADLAKALRMAQPMTIRETIKEHQAALDQFGNLSAAAIKSGGRGPPSRRDRGPLAGA